MQPDPCAPCPACGGLNCLCRPRFFAGQLLTEGDLNRLEQYIVEKNKLHNRYLHGWGVACGLEVVCSPCSNGVIVRPGYALSPCGDDIIVCAETPVDVCKLIDGCCRPEPRDCEPDRPRPDICDDVEQQWILAICYDEKPSRGITPLKGSTEAPCCSKCACGGSGGCGCGSKKSSAAKSSGSCTPSRKAAPPEQCEPTLICESYSFIVYRAPRGRETVNRGALVERMMACLQALTQALPDPPPANATVAQLHTWCCDIREILLDVFADEPGYLCTIFERLGILCRTPNSTDQPAQYRNEILQALVPILVEYLRFCICSAFLPPCPETGPNNCVPLATITVRGRDCRVIRICNLENRKFLTTFPNLQYWLSFLPFGRNLRELLNRLCCRVVERPNPDQPTPVPVPVVPGRRPNFAAAPASAREQTAAFTRMAQHSTERRGDVGNISTISLASLGFYNEAGQPLLSEIELADPGGAVLFGNLIAPMLNDALPAGARDLLGLAFEDSKADTGIRQEVARLSETIRNQQTQIEELRRRLDKNG